MKIRTTLIGPDLYHNKMFLIIVQKSLLHLGYITFILETSIVLTLTQFYLNAENNVELLLKFTYGMSLCAILFYILLQQYHSLDFNVTRST